MLKKLSCGLLALSVAFSSAPALIEGVNSPIGAVDVSATGDGSTITLTDITGFTLKGGKTEPSFSTSTNAYAVTVADGVTSLDLGVTVGTSSSATYTLGSGSQVTFTAIDGTSESVDITGLTTSSTQDLVITAGTETITITLTREAEVVALTDITGFTLTGGKTEPSFSASTNAYAVTVADGVNSLDLGVTVGTSSSATYTLGSGSPVTFTAIDGTSESVDITGLTTASTQDLVITAGTETITITLTREAEVVALTDITGFTLTGGKTEPSFSADTNAYAVTIADSVTSLDLGVTVGTSSSATYTLGSGSQVTFTAIDGTSESVDITGLTTASTQDLVITAGTETITITLTREAEVVADVVGDTQIIIVAKGTDPAPTGNPALVSGLTTVDYANSYDATSLIGAYDVYIVAVADVIADVADTWNYTKVETATDITVTTTTNGFTVVSNRGDDTKTNSTLSVTIAAEVVALTDITGFTLTGGKTQPTFSASTNVYAVTVADGVNSLDLGVTVGTSSSATYTLGSGSPVTFTAIDGTSESVDITDLTTASTQDLVITAGTETITITLTRDAQTLTTPLATPTGTIAGSVTEGNILTLTYTDGASETAPTDATMEYAYATTNNATTLTWYTANPLTIPTSGDYFVYARWNPDTTNTTSTASEYIVSATAYTIDATTDLSGTEVTFDLNGGTSTVPASQTTDRYGKITFPTDPTRADLVEEEGGVTTTTKYTFSGWTSLATGGTAVTADTVFTANNNTVYAQWSTKIGSNVVVTAPDITVGSDGIGDVTVTVPEVGSGDTVEVTLGTVDVSGATDVTVTFNITDVKKAASVVIDKTSLEKLLDDGVSVELTVPTNGDTSNLDTVALKNASIENVDTTVTWTVGSDVALVKDIDLAVSVFDSNSSSKTIAQVVEDVLTNSYNNVDEVVGLLNFSHSGDLVGSGSDGIKVEIDLSGMSSTPDEGTVYLYKLDNGVLTTSPINGSVDSSGILTVTMTTCSDYVMSTSLISLISSSNGGYGNSSSGSSSSGSTSSGSSSSGSSSSGSVSTGSGYSYSGNISVNGTYISELRGVLAGEMVNLSRITTVNGQEVLGWYYDAAFTKAVSNPETFVFTSDVIANGIYAKTTGSASATLPDGSTNAGAGGVTSGAASGSTGSTSGNTSYTPSTVPSTIAKILSKLF